MHELARQRLGKRTKRVSFVERSFRDEDWANGLEYFDCIVTNQAVHELRHKRHAPTLHEQVQAILKPGGLYLVCDHFAGEKGMTDTELYMTLDEQSLALVRGGFGNVQRIKVVDKLAMYRVTARGKQN